MILTMTDEYTETSKMCHISYTADVNYLQWVMKTVIFTLTSKGVQRIVMNMSVCLSTPISQKPRSQTSPNVLCTFIGADIVGPKRLGPPNIWAMGLTLCMGPQ